VATNRPIVHPPGDVLSLEHDGGMNDVDRGNLLTLPPELSGNPTSRDIGSKQEEWAKGMRI
jgi:hypothetical protein